MRGRTGIVLALAGILAAWSGYATNNRPAQVAALLALALLVMAAIYWWAGSAQVTLERTVQPRIVPWGEWMHEHFIVDSRLRLPLIVEILDQTTVPNRPAGIVGVVRRNRAIHSRIEVPCTVRGEHVIGPSLIIVADPLGVIEQQRLAGTMCHVLVLPRTVSLTHTFLRLPGQIRGETQGRGHGEVPPVVATLRPYVPGDPLAAVDWKRLAARGEWVTRQFAPEVETRLWFVVDVDGTDAMTEEGIVVVAASLVRHVVERTHVPVGLMATGGIQHPATRHAGQGRDLLITLARVRSQEEHVLATLQARSPWQGHDGIVLVTARGPEIWGMLVESWRQCGHHVQVAHIADADAWNEGAWWVPVAVAADPHQADALRQSLEGEGDHA